MANEKSIADFVQTLKQDSIRLDRFVRVLGRLEARGKEEEILTLEQELQEVRDEIGRVNAHRDHLRRQKEDLAGTLQDLDDQMNGSKPGPDLIQMRLVLLELDAELDEKIAISRPVELHQQKARLKKDIAARKLLARLATMIGTAARTRSGE